ncbi:SpoIIAA family protein [Salegentibacter sediminis]|uniref:STAS/SEC14 domain-containing protein n=1 Tax=Salegentibacter sediminis TaxID=1930251 RepID=UPI0009BFB917|nr:STAS/SEC14 domain-containing protein [Salegentibacter sediminis]
MEETFTFAENVIGFIVNEEIDQKKMEEILATIKDRLEVVSPICLYLEDASDEGISILAFLKTLEFHFSHPKDFEKIAVVTDDKLFKKSMELKNLLVYAKVKSFERKERLSAMNWMI